MGNFQRMTLTVSKASNKLNCKITFLKRKPIDFHKAVTLYFKTVSIPFCFPSLFLYPCIEFSVLFWPVTALHVIAINTHWLWFLNKWTCVFLNGFFPLLTECPEILFLLFGQNIKGSGWLKVSLGMRKIIIHVLTFWNVLLPS